MKKNLLIVNHVGTSIIQTIQNELKPFLTFIEEKFNDYDVTLAFSSTRAINKLAQKKVRIDSVEQAIYKGYEKGYEQIVILPLHVVGGVDLDITKQYIQECNKKSELNLHNKTTLKLYKPLLSSKENCRSLAILIRDIVGKIDIDTKVLIMGHGTSKKSNNLYEVLNHIFQEMQLNAWVKTLNDDFDTISNKLLDEGIKQVIVFSLFALSGYHVNKDLSSGDHSLQKVLEARHIKVFKIDGGLVSKPSIRQMYIEQLG